MTEKIKNEIINIIEKYVPESRSVYYLDTNKEIYKTFSEIGYRIEFGAFKMVLIPKNKEYNWVIKIPLNAGFYEDGCLLEYRMYKKMVEKNLDCFFAYTYFLCKVRDIPVYIQEKVKPYLYHHRCCLDSTRKIFDICREISKETDGIIEDIQDMIFVLPASWWNISIKNYGVEKVKRLIRLICDGDSDILQTWGDLHQGNFGYRNSDGAPCILDFSEADY